MDCYLTITLSHFVLVRMKSNPPDWSRNFNNACLILFAILATSSICFSEIKTPSVIGDNMVIQQNHKNPIWGWDNPAETIIVKIAGQSHKAKAD